LAFFLCARLKSDFYVLYAGHGVTQSAPPTQQIAQFSERLNPTGNGQCQFASVSDQLSAIDVMVSAEELQSNVASFLKTKPFAVTAVTCRTTFRLTGMCTQLQCLVSYYFCP